MQAWSRQPTQCVFCAFRRSRPTARPLRQVREWSSTPLQSQEQDVQRRHPRKRPRERDGDRNGSDRPQWKDGKAKDTRGIGRRPTFLNDGPTEFEADNDLMSNIEKAAAVLKQRLSTKKFTEDDERNQMQELDPTGQSWKAFHGYLKSLRRKARDGVSTSAKSTWNDLGRLWTKSGETGLETELYFMFLDFSLKPMSTNDVRDAAGMSVDIRYPTEWYANARRAQRTIHLHVGPTNSGKTYNALKRLQESKNGFYAGPLRLLAHEVYSRFRANGVPCDLITGDDIRLEENEDTSVYASTVEMVNTSKEVEVAVIDEIQMMGSEDRGWAWTRAFLGANAKEVHLCGEQRVIPLIRELSASMGDTLKIHHYERLNPLRYLFNDPDNNYDYLVASDAIGMGLNLSVKRIIFNSTKKYDGAKQVQLTIPQIKQIAGRAGRFRSAHQDKNKSAIADKEENVGLVTSLDETDLPVIRAALQTEAPPMRKAGLIPPAEYLEEYAARLPAGVPFEYLMRKVANTANLHPRFFLCDIRDKLALARATDDVPGLTIEQRVNLTAAPANVRDPRAAKCLKALAKVIAGNQSVTVADVQEIPLEILTEDPKPDRAYLENLEVLHKCLILYLWLSYRFITNLRDQPMAVHAKGLTEQKINWTLRAFSANPKLRERLRKIRAEQTNLDPAQFKTDMPKADGTAEVTEKDATMPVEVAVEEQTDESEPELGGMQYTEDAPVRIGEGEESIAEHFAEPGQSLDSEFTGAGNTDEDNEQERLQTDYAEESLIDDLAEPPTANVNEHDLIPNTAEGEHQIDPRPADRASEPIITPEEEAIIEQEVHTAGELQPDPADADTSKPPVEGDVPTAKGQKGEVIDLAPGQVVQEEEVSQPRSASVSAGGSG
ncbi:RNA helicase [Knufia obscura]|uniref:RNA helicase n=1 Tax=Knufia obscura TaxID=1635080 RepID=A0ABR0RD33_9EURO|nr:RNA helicase [Knufia obscura]